MSSTTISPQARRGFAVWNRQLAHYPERARRLRLLLLVVAITIAPYYALYVGGGVATWIDQRIKNDGSVETAASFF
jgi:hypothetical protein